MEFTTLRLTPTTAYLEQQPELLSGFAYRLCESTGVAWRKVSEIVQMLVSLREANPEASKRDDNHNDNQRNGNDAAKWLTGNIAAVIRAFATGMVVDGSPSPRSNIRCWSHGGIVSP